MDFFLQVVEPYSAWGLVNARYGNNATEPERGEIGWIYTKYYVLAQFTRFLRPGYLVLGSNDNYNIVAYDGEGKRVVLITLNIGEEVQELVYDLREFNILSDQAAVVFTKAMQSQVFIQDIRTIEQGYLRVQAEPYSIYSIIVDATM